MEISGKVIEISETQQVSDKFKKRELVIEYAENAQYPEYIKFEAGNDKCSLLDSVRPGDDIEVFFNLRGRPWTDKTGKKTYFNSLQLWKVNVLGKAPEQTKQVMSAPDETDDLPF